MEYREPEIGDAAAVAALIDALSAYEGNVTGGFTAEAALADVIAEDGPMSAVLAVNEGQPVGVIMWHDAYESAYAARGGYVTDLFVTPEARGQGVGRRLLGEAARRVKAKRGVYLWLTALKWNEDARAFYRKIATVEEEGVVAFAIIEGMEALVQEAS